MRGGTSLSLSVNSADEAISYLYDGDQAICEYGGTNTLTAKYIYGPGIDEPILLDDGANQYYYHFDGLGSVTALTDTNGDLTEEYSYDIFGKVTGSFSSIGNPYYFTGRRYDEETGLYYYRARMYDPNIGRFLQTDPIGYYAGMNLYTYVNNNPTSFIDPLGLDKQKGAPGGVFPKGQWPPKKDARPDKPKAGEEPKKGVPEEPAPEDPTPNEPTAEKEPKRQPGFWETYIRLLKEKVTDPEPPKDKTLEEKKRVVREWIDRLGMWIPL